MTVTAYQQNGAAAVAVPSEPPSQVSAVAALVEWAHGAQAAYEVAENLVNTSFCPKHYQQKPHEATAAILAGLEVGLSPMAALQAFHSIQGVAAPKAVTLRAIVQSRGHHVDIVEASATRVVAVGRRKGSTVEQRSEWTIERATLAGLPGKNQNWKSQPTAMLIARATSEICRLVASDAILGIPYSVEELEDGGPVQAVAEQTTPPVAASSRRRNPARVIPEQTPAELPAGEAPGSTRLDPKGEVLARLVELLKGRDDPAAFVSGVVGREVHHPKDLTHAEAYRVIDRLTEQTPPVEGEQAGGGS